MVSNIQRWAAVIMMVGSLGCGARVICLLTEQQKVWLIGMYALWTVGDSFRREWKMGQCSAARSSRGRHGRASRVIS